MPIQVEGIPRFRGLLGSEGCRIRTGEDGFGAQKSPRPASSSDAKLDGSDSLNCLVARSKTKQLDRITVAPPVRSQLQRTLGPDGGVSRKIPQYREFLDDGP